MAESVNATATTANITLKGTSYYLNGERVTKAFLTRRKGSGKERVAWQGDAFSVGLATFRVGAVLADSVTGVTWSVTMETAKGAKAKVTLQEYFDIQ